MLLCSDYILNSCPAGAHEIAPWVSRTVNVKDSGDRNRTVKVPDVDPCALLFGTPSPGPDTPPPDFSMAAGEFLDCYNKPEEVSCQRVFECDEPTNLVLWYSANWR